MSGRLARAVLRLAGWELVDAGVPTPRGVLIVYPHTSNWDFAVGLLARRCRRRPFLRHRATVGRLLRRWGGRPVDRHRSSGAVQQLAEHLCAESRCWLALSPEGTRRYLPHLRSGRR